MQIEFIDIFYGLLISGTLLILIKYINKKYILKDKKCIKFDKQIKHYSINDNDIDEKIVRELYELIEKYFDVKKCYLSPDDKMKFFYDLSSFDLHENYEDFIVFMDRDFKVTVKIEDELIDLLVRMRHFYKPMLK